MLVKLILKHDTQGYQTLFKTMSLDRYKRLHDKVGEKDGKVELIRLEIVHL